MISHTEQKSDWPDTRPVALGWKWSACSPFPLDMKHSFSLAECLSATQWRCKQIFQLWNACDNEDSGRTEVDQISLCVPVIMATFHRFHCPEWQALFGRECMLSVSRSASGTEPPLRTGGWRLRRESSYTHLPRVTAHKWVQEHKPSKKCSVKPCTGLNVKGKYESDTGMKRK